MLGILFVRVVKVPCNSVLVAACERRQHSILEHLLYFFASAIQIKSFHLKWKHNILLKRITFVPMVTQFIRFFFQTVRWPFTLCLDKCFETVIFVAVGGCSFQMPSSEFKGKSILADSFNWFHRNSNESLIFLRWNGRERISIREGSST